MTDETTTDINELFSRDPLSLTNSDIDEIILHMRKRRQLFNTTPTTKAGGPKKLTKAQETVRKIDLDFKL